MVLGFKMKLVLRVFISAQELNCWFQVLCGLIYHSLEAGSRFCMFSWPPVFSGRVFRLIVRCSRFPILYGCVLGDWFQDFQVLLLWYNWSQPFYNFKITVCFKFFVRVLSSNLGCIRCGLCCVPRHNTPKWPSTFSLGGTSMSSFFLE